MDFTTRNALRHAGDHRISRRNLLGAAGSGSILCTISRAFAEEDANPQPSVNKAKNVILLWLEGGPSQWETFDPHPNSRYSGEASAIRTRVPDLMISELLPQTAEIMHHATLIRSLTSKGDHERAVYNIKSGFRPDPTLIHPSIGASICHENEEAAELPRHISIVPKNSPGVGGFLVQNTTLSKSMIQLNPFQTLKNEYHKNATLNVLMICIPSSKPNSNAEDCGNLRWNEHCIKRQRMQLLK